MNPDAGFAVSATDVPGAKLIEQVLGQDSPPPMTVPLPLTVTVSTGEVMGTTGGATTATFGELAVLVRLPALVDDSSDANVKGATEDGAVTPGPPDACEP